jgi:putative oxidoreductase
MQIQSPVLTTVVDVHQDPDELIATQRQLRSEHAPLPKAAAEQASGLSRFLSWVTSPITTAPRATALIRLMAGAVFLSEGILKFVYANQGVGRFTKLGFPFPDATATAIGAFEIVGGALLISGLFTRLIAIGFSIEMVVAMLTTKISLYLGTSPLPLPAAPPKVGIWAVLHETRSDWAQLVCCVFLIVVGAGAMSLDARRSKARLAAGT